MLSFNLYKAWSLRRVNAAARVHYASRRRGGSLAARGARAAAGDPLIGIINAGSAASTAKGYEAFRSELRRLGYVEGRNIRFEFRFADGFLDRLPRPRRGNGPAQPGHHRLGAGAGQMAVHKPPKRSRS